jgi:drug/metabolite transporter (DMT)-like permease
VRRRALADVWLVRMNHAASRRTYAIIALVVLMIVWGSTFVVTKAAAREMPPLTLAAVRFMIAAAALIPLALARGGLRRLPKPVPVVPLVLMGLTGIALFTIGFNYALVYGSASQGALIYALVPAAVAATAALVLKEALSRRRITGIVLSIAGVLLVAAAGEPDVSAPNPLLGAACMLGAVVAWTGYTIVAKRLANADQVVVSACLCVVGTAMLLPLSLLELAIVPWPDPSLEAWLGIAFLGTVASAAAYVAYGYALRELDASLVGAYANLDPIVGVLAAVVFLGEALHGWQIAGGIIALCGMWLASTNGPTSVTRVDGVVS